MTTKPENTEFKVQEEKQVKQEKVKETPIEPRYPGITEEAFNFLHGVATNNNMPQILKNADFQFEVLAPTIFGGSDHEKGLKATLELCNNARNVMTARLDHAMSQAYSWHRASQDERAMLSKIDQIQAVVVSSFQFQHLTGIVQDSEMEGSTPRVHNPAEVERIVQSRVEAHMAVYEEKAAKRHRSELDEVINKMDRKIETLQCQLATKVNSPDLDVLIWVKGRCGGQRQDATEARPASATSGQVNIKGANWGSSIDGSVKWRQYAYWSTVVGSSAQGQAQRFQRREAESIEAAR